MLVSTKDVSAALQDLMTGGRSREEIASWAREVRAAEDRDDLEYSPKSAEESIWDALEFLMGVDLKVAAETYLHGRADFEAYWVTSREGLSRSDP